MVGTQIIKGLGETQGSKTKQADFTFEEVFINHTLELIEDLHFSVGMGVIKRQRVFILLPAPPDALDHKLKAPSKSLLADAWAPTTLQDGIGMSIYYQGRGVG